MKNNLQVPSREESIKIFQKYVLFSNVEQHGVTTATVAMYIAEKIKAKVIPDLNLDIVFATALFHDLGKGAVIAKLEPEKYGFKPFTKEQVETWKLLREFYKPMKNLFDDLNSFHPNLNKTVHETDVASVIIGSLFPDFIHYMHQIGGTRNTVYFNAGPEIKIMHYGDWIVHGNDLIAFDKRLDYLFDVYWKELSDEQRKARKKKEFALEKQVLKDAGLTDDLDLKELNKKKSELFNGQYDHFKIGRVDGIE